MLTAKNLSVLNFLRTVVFTVAPVLIYTDIPASRPANTEVGKEYSAVGSPHQNVLYF